MGGVALTGARPDPVTIAGAVICVFLAGVHRWLTAREEQRLGARLRRSEAYFRSVVQSAGDAVVILDDDLRVSWASPALERALGAAAPPRWSAGRSSRRCTPTTSRAGRRAPRRGRRRDATLPAAAAC